MARFCQLPNEMLNSTDQSSSRRPLWRTVKEIRGDRHTLGRVPEVWRKRGKVTAMRAIVFLIIALMLGGCMQGTLAPATQVGWTGRDKQLMANLPYRQATIPEQFRRHIVEYTRKEAPGTIVVDTGNKFLYYILPKGQAIRYGITVGEEGQAWSGIASVGRKEEWPSWTPTAGEHSRFDLPAFVAGGPQNPMGARGLYLYSGSNDTGYRIHGTNQPEYIGRAISSGCIRMTNEDVMDLYNRVKIGTIVIVLPPSRWTFSPHLVDGPNA